LTTGQRREYKRPANVLGGKGAITEGKPPTSEPQRLGRRAFISERVRVAVGKQKRTRVAKERADWAYRGPARVD